MVRLSRCTIIAVLLATGLLTAGAPAHAQFWGGPRQGGGFFGGLFGGGPQYYERQRPQRQYDTESRHEPQADFSHAPPPRKAEAKDAPPPSTTIMVMGDGMAGWLAYGLEDAFSDSPDVAIVRKDKPYSGLLRYDAKNDLDWWRVAADILNQQKPSYIVMMLGVGDRQNIRERDLAKEAAREAKEQDDKKTAADNPVANAPGDKKPEDANSGETDKGKSEPDKKTAEQSKPKRVPTGNLEFRSEQWEKVYTKRIDETIAALKSKGVPVFWVGLPPIRGTKSTADTSYLDGLFRARAQRAGIVYIDVWDGFVNENGRYTNYGPDYEGQNRRLRSSDGVYFTNYGARKLAHYVEREIRRYMTNRIVALPSQPTAPTAAGPGKPSERPLAGPVVPLAAVPTNSDELLGPGSRAHGDALAARVLVKGEPITPQVGRADDFAWPPGSNPRPPAAEPAKAPAAPKPAATAPVPARPANAPVQAVSPPALPPKPSAETEASAQPAEPTSLEPQPPVTAAPASAGQPERPKVEAKPKEQPPKRAEARPHPPQHHAPARAPARPAPEQRRASDPFSALFGSFR